MSLDEAEILVSVKSVFFLLSFIINKIITCRLQLPSAPRSAPFPTSLRRFPSGANYTTASTVKAISCATVWRTRPPKWASARSPSTTTCSSCASARSMDLTFRSTAMRRWASCAATSRTRKRKPSPHAKLKARPRTQACLNLPARSRSDAAQGLRDRLFDFRR